jgi:TM2 domain-containing membrane protein YozV
MQDNHLQVQKTNFFSLFASTSTLICCALPALFVSLGAGASFASLVSAFPFLITVSQYKVPISAFALFLVVVAGIINYRSAKLPCPIDPELGRVCMQTRRRSQRLYFISTGIFVFASFFTYVVPLII